MCFMVGLSDRARKRFEQNSRIDLTDAQELALGRTKTVHFFLVLVVLVMCLLLVAGDYLTEPLMPAYLLLESIFWVGGVAEAFVPGAPATQTLLRIGKATGAWLLGQFVFFQFQNVGMSAGK